LQTNPKLFEDLMMATQSWAGKTALVIGGSSGIGRATALAFASAGANVFIVGLGGVEGGEVEASARAAGVDAVFMEADVSREDEVKAFTEAAVTRFGRIHAAVNNAGVEGPYGPVHTLSSADFDHVIGVNLKGIWLGMKHQIPHMLAHGGGAIVNMASSAGTTGIPNVAIYTASKHGVVGLTRAAALELARTGIRVNAVAPGPVDTGLLHRMVGGHVDLDIVKAGVPMHRISQPEETAHVIVWLCSDEASFVTGHVLAVDGGLTAA
jgi:NAD(P)-dependent dehydrogenase (short-subunit alcohol dehydrogenase family)